MSSQRSISSFFAPVGRTAPTSKSTADSTSKPGNPKSAQPPKANGPTAKPVSKTKAKGKTKAKVAITPEPDERDDEHDKDEEEDPPPTTSFSKRVRAFSVQSSSQPHSTDSAAPAPKRVRLERRIVDDEEEAEEEEQIQLGDPIEEDGVDEVEEPLPHKQSHALLKKSGKGIIANRFTFSSSQPGDSSAHEEDELTPEEALRKKKNHEKFVRKLGRPGAFEIREKENGEDGDGELDDDEEEPERAPEPKKGSKAAAKKGKKLTPLEQQVVDIKEKNADTVLVVEVGYKYRFFGEDARIAASVLSIVCIPGRMKFTYDPSEAHLDKFASASIPVHRLHVHVKRLITAGYKVGVVRQLETAALKAAGDNRNAPFVRKLTNLYTKGTYIDDIDGVDDHDAVGAGSGGAASTGYLLCITEKLGGGAGADEKVKVGILAVQPSTGDIIYDEFDDGFMRSEIETRLLHIAPCELLILGELSKATDKLVTHLAGSTNNVFGDGVRVERVERPKKMHTTSPIHVSEFYAEKLKSDEGALPQDLLDIVTQLPDLVTICLSAMITHLTAYGLEHVFDLTKYFKSFSARSHMLLNGNTLSSLEIYRNQTDFSEKGSLFWTLDHTSTRFGRRLLRKWVGRPLLDRVQLQARVNAVEEMLSSTSERTQQLKTLLTTVRYDLEKGLIRIYYGKATRPEVFNILNTLLKIAKTFRSVESPEECGYDSPLINGAMASLPGILESVEGYLSKFDHKAATKDDKYSFFKEVDEYDYILDSKMAIKGVEFDLQEHLPDAAKAVKKKKLDYVTVSGIDYLVEIENSGIKNVPASWVKISGTKKVSRFHTPEVLRLLRERDQRKETLANDCDRAFKDFMTQIASQYQEYRDAVQSLATLDCLVSLANVAQLPGYCKPTITDGIGIKVKQGRHPMVEQLLIETYVPNDIDLGADQRRTLLVTGPNMGGKSSYVRQIALIAIMAQIGSYVPADSAEIGLLDAVFTRMGAFDNMMTGESTFMVELSETSDILKQATPRSLVILDELGRGTSTHDGVAIAYSVLDYMVSSIKAMTLFVTHYPILAQMEKAYPGEVVNAHMRFEEATDGSEDITFLYQIAEGTAHRSYGLNVAKLANVPQAVLDTAAVKSKELEVEIKGRETARWFANILHGNINAGDGLLSEISSLSIS
ncbi:Mismatch repair protein msh3 [Orbilia javanica]|uniref:DNA mismatch repair protein n=1 Tax=Orbilia javanica TaxID=47235 RepID=A0AAN8NED2_9PEZI